MNNDIRELDTFFGNVSGSCLSTMATGPNPYTFNPVKIEGPTVVMTPALQKQLDAMKVNPSVATKFDSGKTDWSLMPFDAVEEINKVLDFGAKKYSAHNWKKGGGFKYTRVLGSLLRHVFAYMRGEDKDPESGLSHLAHAGCNVLFLLHYSLDKKKYTNDDRVTA